MKKEGGGINIYYMTLEEIFEMINKEKEEKRIEKLASQQKEHELNEKIRSNHKAYLDKYFYPFLSSSGHRKKNKTIENSTSKSWYSDGGNWNDNGNWSDL